MKKNLIISSLLCAVGLISVPAHAQVSTLISDAFTEATVNGTGASATVTSGPYTYYNLGASTPFAGTDGSGGLKVNSSWKQGYVQYAPVTLGSVGDYVQLSFTVQYPSAPGDVGGALRFGLFNTDGDVNRLFPGDAETNPVGGTATGYFAAVNTGATGNTNMYRNAGATVGSLLSTDGANRLVGFSGAVFGTTAQTIVMTIARTETGLSLTGSVAGTAFNVTNQVGTPATYTYDTFLFASGNQTLGYTLDDLSVTASVSTIPEPSSVALLAAGGVGMFALVRRRRR